MQYYLTFYFESSKTSCKKLDSFVQKFSLKTFSIVKKKQCGDKKEDLISI